MTTSSKKEEDEEQRREELRKGAERMLKTSHIKGNEMKEEWKRGGKKLEIRGKKIKCYKVI